jgi:hypothetical protein
MQAAGRASPRDRLDPEVSVLFAEPLALVVADACRRPA